MVPPGHNRLSESLSPYLLMHKANPVHWYPWGEEAFSDAKSRDLPIFLSIGYAACHWCHVMEQECFSDRAVSTLLNEHFISIKVDREERPDIDQFYMTVCQLMTGSGGWPMSIFLTPDRVPFYAATYIPKSSRPGMVGMMELIPYLMDIWKTRREEVHHTSNRIVQAVKQIALLKPGDASKMQVHEAYHQLSAAYDSRYGGFSQSPKFPSVPQLFFLLRYACRHSTETAWKMAEHTLRQMAISGISDPISGGFHRYATDRAWKVPHFEKMLYDQALLAMVYCEGYQISRDPLFERAALSTLTYVCSSFLDPMGGFWSSVDADSEGEEGSYYLWTMDEVRNILGKEDGERYGVIYGFTKEGNARGGGISQGMNVHYPAGDPLDILRKMQIPDPEGWLDSAHTRLRETRNRRVYPAIDDKILTDWNGLMISALAKGYRTFGQVRFYHAAVRAAHFLLENLTDSEGRLFHTWRQETKGSPGMSADYVFLASGLLELFQIDGEIQWLNSCIRLVTLLENWFRDPANGGYYSTDAEAFDLPVRLKDLMDHALPSVNGTAAMLMHQLGLITGEREYTRRFEQLMRLVGDVSGPGIGAMLSFFSAGMEHEMGFRLFFQSPDSSREIAALLPEAGRSFLPGSVIVPVNGGDDELFLYIRDIPYSDHPALMICGNGTCYPPIHSPYEFERWIRSLPLVPNSKTG